MLDWMKCKYLWLAMLWALAAPLHADDVISVKRMTLELANEIAINAIEACRKDGYSVAAVVVDRNAITQVVMRDVLASRFFMEIAERKAKAAVMTGTDVGAFREQRADIRPELNELDEILMMDGALPISAAGSVIGGIGVSGAPGGDLDKACAQKGLDAVQARLDFID